MDINYTFFTGNRYIGEIDETISYRNNKLQADNTNFYKKKINIQTGKVKVGRREIILKSDGLGSCIAVIGYDSVKKIGGIAHIMLSGSSKKAGKSNKAKYAEDGIDELLFRMQKLGSDYQDIEFSLIGGANVLKKEDSVFIPKNNIDSVVKYLNKRNCIITYRDLGGVHTRSVSLDVGSGKIWNRAIVDENIGVQKLIENYKEKKK